MVGIKWVREFLGDIKKTLFGLVVIGRHCLTQDQLSMSLSQFSTPTAQAQVGVAKAYEIVLANSADQHRWGRLVIDVFLKQASQDSFIPHGHMACVEKRIFIKRGTSQKVGLIYNWRERMRFELEGLVCAPDHFWYEPSRARAATYWVRVKLLARSGSGSELGSGPEEQLEELALVQRLGV